MAGWIYHNHPKPIDFTKWLAGLMPIIQSQFSSPNGWLDLLQSTKANLLYQMAGRPDLSQSSKANLLYQMTGWLGLSQSSNANLLYQMAGWICANHPKPIYFTKWLAGFITIIQSQFTLPNGSPAGINLSNNQTNNKIMINK